jgi:hypothetical protein
MESCSRLEKKPISRGSIRVEGAMGAEGKKR